MKILVCFKVVPDLDRMRKQDWVPEGLQVETGFVPTMINPYDESALELALKLRDEGAAELTALTVDGKGADPFLKKLYALKFDRVVRLECGEDLRFCPERTAEVIARYVRDHTFDLIITGTQSGVGDNGKLPLLLAEMLGIPCYCRVEELKRTDGDLCVSCRVDGGSVRMKVQTPGLLAVGNVAGACLRIPTLKDKLEFGKRPVDVLDVDAGGSKDACALMELRPVTKERQGLVLEGETVAEKAQKLFDLYLRERLMK